MNAQFHGALAFFSVLSIDIFKDFISGVRILCITHSILYCIVKHFRIFIYFHLTVTDSSKCNPDCYVITLCCCCLCLLLFLKHSRNLLPLLKAHKRMLSHSLFDHVTTDKRYLATALTHGPIPRTRDDCQTSCYYKVRNGGKHEVMGIVNVSLLHVAILLYLWACHVLIACTFCGVQFASVLQLYCTMYMCSYQAVG